MQPYVVACWDFLTDVGRKALENNPSNIPIHIIDRFDEESLQNCEILFGTPDPSILPQMPKLRWLSTPMAGVGQFCDPTLYQNPVTLTNSAGAYGVAISEHLLTMTLMLLRRMDQYYAQQMTQGWGLIGKVRPVRELTVTVVGLGDIGSSYAQSMHFLGAKVRGVKRTATACPDFVDELYTTDRLDEALQGADVVALALPGTAETNGILSRERLQALKPGCIILNVGRGTAIDQDAMVELLESGHLGGAGLDVCTPEPLPQGHPLWTAPRVVLTPHISGFNSMDYTLNLIVDMFIENLGRFAAGEPLLRVVDMQRGY